MSIEIIHADVSMAAAIASIGKKTFRSSFGHLFNNKDELIETLEQVYNPLKIARSTRKPDNRYFVAVWDGIPVGFAKLKFNSLNEHIESVSQVELQKIYVLPEYQRKGVGSALLDRAMHEVQVFHPDYIWLDICSAGFEGHRFSEAHGFEKVGQYHFAIGSQLFEYHVMACPVAVNLLKAS